MQQREWRLSTHTTQTFTPPAGFKPARPARDLPHSLALDNAGSLGRCDPQTVQAHSVLLYRCTVLSKSKEQRSKYTKLFTYFKWSMSLTVPILTKATNAQRNLVCTLYTEFQRNRSNRLLSTGRHSLTPCNKVWMSLPRFSRNSHLLKILVKIKLQSRVSQKCDKQFNPWHEAS